jgi:serine/threonine protein phosphatase PrpC
MNGEEQTPMQLVELPKCDKVSTGEHDGTILSYVSYTLGCFRPIYVCMGPLGGGQVFCMLQPRGQGIDIDKISSRFIDFLQESFATSDRTVEQVLQAAIASLEKFWLNDFKLDSSTMLELAVIYIRRQEVWVANVGSIEIALWSGFQNAEIMAELDGPEMVTQLHSTANREEARRIDNHLSALANMDKRYHLSILSKLADVGAGPHELARVIGLRACKEDSTGIIAEPYIKKLPLDLDRSNVQFLVGTSGVWNILRSEKIDYSGIVTGSEGAVACKDILKALVAAHPESKKNALRIFQCQVCSAKLLAAECADHKHYEAPRSLYDLSFFGRGLGIAVLDIFGSQ